MAGFCGGVGLSKFETFDEYPAGCLASAEAVLLTTWRSLERYQDDLVLVGGLAVHCLTKRNVVGLPGAVTMDVDFGISLGASGGQYGTIKSDLAGLGFKSEGNRLVRKFGNLNLNLDFLTEDMAAVKGTRLVDDVVTSLFPGVNRALACRRMVSVSGQDLYGRYKHAASPWRTSGRCWCSSSTPSADQRDGGCPKTPMTYCWQLPALWTDPLRRCRPSGPRRNQATPVMLAH